MFRLAPLLGVIAPVPGAPSAKLPPPPPAMAPCKRRTSAQRSGRAGDQTSSSRTLHRIEALSPSCRRDGNARSFRKPRSRRARPEKLQRFERQRMVVARPAADTADRSRRERPAREIASCRECRNGSSARTIERDTYWPGGPRSRAAPPPTDQRIRRRPARSSCPHQHEREALFIGEHILEELRAAPPTLS